MGIKWANDGEWVISLGVPIGNEVDAERFWKQKLKAVRAKSKRWLGMYRSTYFGRTLVVQAMYLGSLQYWLHSLLMSRAMTAQIQADVDRLVWAREPDIDGTARFRRYIAKQTAVGSVNEGGANAIAWAEHVDAFHVDWMVRYLHPADSSWKRALDQMLLLDKNGEEKFSEGRGILVSKIRNGEKKRLLRK